MKAKDRVKKMLSQRFNDFHRVFEEEKPGISCGYTPHCAAWEKLDKELELTMNFIEKFTPASEREKKYLEVLKTLINCDYPEKINEFKNHPDFLPFESEAV